MRKIVTKEWLAKEIDREMGHPRWEGRNFWTSVEIRKRREDGDPNWRYSFNAGEVPAGFVNHWEAVRKKFEDAYAVPED